VQLEDQLGVVRRQTDVLNGVATQVASGARHKDQPVGFDTGADSLKSLSNFMTFMQTNMGSTAETVRQLERQMVDVDEDINIARGNFNEFVSGRGGTQSR
jgi:hypothetical protein